MIKVTNVKIFNFDGAFRGMRNPMSSWKQSDSYFDNYSNIIGDKDIALAQKLIKAGPDHSKFMRQIFVSMDITAPLYWWKEMDTYKVGTVANSTSTMHKLSSKPLTEEDFSFDKDWDLFYNMAKDSIIGYCEQMRKKYVATNDKRYWRALIQLLPESYNQTRTWTSNYAILRNIYFSRSNHKLSEWHDFCREIERLPFSKDLIQFTGGNDETN